MEDFYKLYKAQRKKAKLALESLERQREEIYQKLQFDESNSFLQKDLRSINLDIKITMNEIEHTEDNIQECESKNSSILN
jgi:hypothetical protein